MFYDATRRIENHNREMMRVVVDGKETDRRIDRMEPNSSGFMETHPELQDNERVMRTVSGEVHIYKV